MYDDHISEFFLNIAQKQPHGHDSHEYRKSFALEQQEKKKRKEQKMACFSKH